MRVLRITGAAVATLGFVALTLALLVFAVIYVIALFQGDHDTATWVFAVAAIILVGLAGLSLLLARFCARPLIERPQN